MAATMPMRLSDFYGAPASDILGAICLPKRPPIPHLTGLERRVLQDVIDWGLPTTQEVATAIGSTRKEVARASAHLEELTLVTRHRSTTMEPLILTATNEGRRVVRVIKDREAV